jgi:Ca-activated chloride channel family protein
MTFAHPQLFWLLVLPAALLLATLRRARTAAVSAHPKIPRVLLHSSPGANPRATAHRTARPVALALALSAIILALARPQGATLPGLAHSNAREVLVAVDVSRSMLADDLKPDRLSRARLLIRALLDELKGERLGLLPFAGTAFLQSPLSSDYEIFRTFLDELGPDMIPAGGSNFSALLKTAADAFSTSDADRYLIILSDGEAQDDNWRAPAEALAKRGVRILSLGLGTLDGAMVPDGKGGLVKDQRGAVVLTRLDATTLRELARATGGEYRDATTFVDLPALLRATIAQGRAGAFEETDATRRVELFPWFLAPALLLLAYALWREFPPVPTPRKTQLLAAARAALWLLFLHPAFVIGHSSFAAEASSAAPAPDPLVSLVGQLATAPTLVPADLAHLAELTASTGETARAAKKNLPEGALRDALAAIDSGNTTAPSAADWPALRKRIETLLAPPPQPPKKEESKPQDSPDKKDQSKDDQKSDQSKSDKSDSSENQSSPSDSKKPDDPSGSPSESQSPSSKDETPKPSSGDDKSNDPSPDAKDPSSPSDPSTEKPLSDLASDPKQPPEKGTDSAPPSPPPPDASTQQQAGGVAAEGTTDPSAADPANANPALMVPRQKLDNVRASDSPARLYQLLNDSESPPGSATRAAGRKQDW